MVQCVYHVPGGARCKVRTTNITYPCCWIHTRYGKRGAVPNCGAHPGHVPNEEGEEDFALSLRVAESSIAGAGKGLFAFNPKKHRANIPVFAAGDFICQYFGAIIPEDPNVDLPYAFDIGTFQRQKFIINAGPFESSVAKYANDRGFYKDAQGIARYDPKRNNGIFRKEGRWQASTPLAQRRVWLMADTDIFHGEEIFVTYGAGYWEKELSNKKGRPKNKRQLQKEQEESSEEEQEESEEEQVQFDDEEDEQKWRLDHPQVVIEEEFEPLLKSIVPPPSFIPHGVPEYRVLPADEQVSQPFSRPSVWGAGKGLANFVQGRQLREKEASSSEEEDQRSSSRPVAKKKAPPRPRVQMVPAPFPPEEFFPPVPERRTSARRKLVPTAITSYFPPEPKSKKGK